MPTRAHVLLRLPALAVLAIVVGCSTAERSVRASEENERKAEAAVAWRNIVRTYFSQDCAQYRSMFTSKIKIVNPYVDTLFDTAPLFDAEQLCDKIGLWTGGLMSADDYLARYDVVVYSRREILDSTLRMSERDMRVLRLSGNSRVYLALLNEHPGGLTDDDYLIFGDVEKDATEKGGLGSAFTPIIRRTPDGWKISGMLP